ncbi:MAG: NHLP bacteriocin export ABC transporter permease/ATPase subunit [Oscillospiraceae bacterium]|nr:NHLP bacteriocin export ABC transporter permease/ATPase subunit [Oscillospiraceae bacterium]
MSWFDDQIRMRQQKDQEVFEDSIFRMASVVLGKRGAGTLNDERIVTKAAIDEILKYHHIKPADIPEEIRDAEEQMEYALRPHGIMRRRVDLEEGWYRNAFGPMLGYYGEERLPVALLPKAFRGYCFVDPVSGTRRDLNRETAAAFARDAVCFYRPLPLKKLGVPDLLNYLKDCLDLGDVLIFAGLTLLVTLVGMLMPRITRELTGPVLEHRSVSMLLGAAVFLFCTILSSQLIGSLKSLTMDRIQIKTSLSVEAAVMMRVIDLPASFFRNYSSGELSSRFGAVRQLCDVMVANVFSLGLSSLVSLLYITQIFAYAPALVTPALLIILATVTLGVVSALKQRKISQEIMERGAKNDGMSFALINGVQKIKLAGAEKRAFARWAESYSSVAELEYDPPLFLKIGGVLSTAVALAGSLMMYFLAVKSGVTPSEYLAFNAAYGMVSGAFSALSGVALTVAQIRPILAMAEPILKTEPESSEMKTMVTRLSGSIELSNVRFRYGEDLPYVLDGMDLKIRAGEYVAIVGRTGCGKSTLMRLLLGYEEPEKGAIYYDGRDMRKLDLRSLRRKIGAVMQTGSLFQGDIYSNIVITAPQLSLDEAWEAAELAGIADDIRAMPMGMHTLISEGQGGISGGQKQRLMIARAVAPKPRILMFDEATSALDNKTQKQVSDALDGLKCTRIVIAHRLSTIQHCDRILVLDGGKIVEDGTYEELLERNGLFSALVAKQRLDTGA